MSSKQAKPRKYKVRYGQGEKAAQLPAGTTETAAAGEAAKVPPGTQGAGAQAADAGMESRLTPESQQMLGTAPEAPQKKTRMTQARGVAAQGSEGGKDRGQGGGEESEHARASGCDRGGDAGGEFPPLGLGGQHGGQGEGQGQAGEHGEKQRLEDAKTKQAAQLKQNPGTPGAVTATNTSTPVPVSTDKKQA